MLRPWELNVVINRDSDVAIYLQIAHGVIEEIQRGRLPPGTVLPGSRELADKLEINRKTVILAYDELIAQGWLVAEGKRGTFVSHSIPVLSASSKDKKALATHIAPLGYKLYGSPFSSEFHGAKANVISFTDGVPDTRLIPFEALSRAFRHALIVSARANRLGYDDPRGSLVLREAIVSMMNMERGLNADVDNVCIVRGSQMGIFLSARILANPGDYVVLERLSYPPAREAFESCGARVLSVGMDAQGMKMAELEDLCRQYRVRAVYVTPHHQFPTTVMMTADRRLKLLMLAEQYDFAIVEDDYDHEFHFSHHPMFPLASMDRSGRVIYVGSLSKVLAPGLRVGYIAAPTEIINRCASEIMLIDRQGNAVTELAVAELLATGEVKRHIRRTLKIYNERRQFLAELVSNELRPFVNFALPDGGLAFWLRLSDRIDIQQLLINAEECQVRVLPGVLFSVENQPVQAIRLGYGNLDINELTLGIRRLKQAFERCTV